MDSQEHLPTYRAKDLKTKTFIEGTGLTDFLNISTMHPEYAGDGRMWLWSNYAWVEINPNTLSIHFPNMIVEKSNRILPNGKTDLRVFASLNSNGEYGDIVKYRFGGEEKVEPLVYGGGYGTIFYMNTYDEYEIIGVKE